MRSVVLTVAVLAIGCGTDQRVEAVGEPGDQRGGREVVGQGGSSDNVRIDVGDHDGSLEPSCPSGLFDHDGDPATPCVAVVPNCDLSESYESPSLGESGARVCLPLNPCQPGQEQVADATAGSDYDCRTCAAGEVCDGGEEVIVCRPGEYCPDGLSYEDCGQGLFCDGATIRIECSENESFSPDPSAAAPCVPWSKCSEGFREAAAPTGVQDRLCEPEPWLRQHGTAELDGLKAVALDAQDGIYVAGFTYGALVGNENVGGSDGVVWKYSTTGDELWSVQFGTEGTDRIESIAVSAEGELYLGGFTSGEFVEDVLTGFDDCFVRKLDSDGVELWTIQFGTWLGDRIYGSVLDGSGHVYVAGSTMGDLSEVENQGGTDAFVRKLDASTGGEIWTHQFGTMSHDQATALAVNAAGELYVTGYVSRDLVVDGWQGSADVFVRKLTAAGDEVWTIQFGTSGTNQAEAIAVDHTDAVYVAGRTWGDLAGWVGGYDAFVAKFNSAGDALWTSQFGSPEVDVARFLAIAPGGGVYVGGQTAGNVGGGESAGDYDEFLAKLSESGEVSWMPQFGGTGADYGFGGALDASGNLYVVGLTDSDLTGAGYAGHTDAYIRQIESPELP